MIRTVVIVVSNGLSLSTQVAEGTVLDIISMHFVGTTEQGRVQRSQRFQPAPQRLMDYSQQTFNSLAHHKS